MTKTGIKMYDFMDFENPLDKCNFLFMDHILHILVSNDYSIIVTLKCLIISNV